MSRESVAVYWDFENIHASLYDLHFGQGNYQRTENRGRSQEYLVDVQALSDFSASFGNIVINKAYCNWQWFSKYRHVLLRNAIELIQMFPPGASAKNGADIKLALDVVEDIIKFSHISTIVIVGGDSDFIPLAQKVKAAGKELVGVGCSHSTNAHWANSCTEFRYYESLIFEEDEPEQPVEEHDAGRLIVRAIQRLSKNTGDKWVLKAAIRPMVKRLDPTFDEARHQCETFAELLEQYADLLLLRQGEHDHEIALRDNSSQKLGSDLGE